VLGTLIIVFVPLILLAALAFVRQPSRLQFWLYTLALGLAVVYMWLVFPWAYVSTLYRVVLPLLLIAAVYMGYRRIGTQTKAVARWQMLMNVSINLLLVVFMGGLCGFAIKGYFQPPGAIDLSSPFREGTFIVGHGGSSPFINAHAKVRPQNHALDILGLNAWGNRKDPFSDLKDLDSYAIFDKPLYSPCEGEVLLAVDGLEDLLPPAMDRENLAGNHVVIACLGVKVVLAHMKKGSILVTEGQQLDTDTQLGNVGNSGNTSEPHLHIHAETGAETPLILKGDAVPITIDGRYLVRGSIL